MNTHIETIDPAKATWLLSLNEMNRPVCKPHVDFLTREMQEGRFVTTGQSIQIAENGQLLDGQHRLLALIKAEQSYSFVVVTDLPPAIFSKIDQGRKRTAGESLATSGSTQGVMRAAVAIKLMHYEAGRMGRAAGGGDKLPVSTVLDYCAAHNLDRALTLGHTLHTQSSFFTRSEWAFMSEVLSRFNAELADSFLNQLASGSQMPKDDVVLFVRNRIIRAALNASSGLSAAIKMQYVWSAWNRVRDNRRTGMVKIVTDHPVTPR